MAEFYSLNKGMILDGFKRSCLSLPAKWESDLHLSLAFVEFWNAACFEGKRKDPFNIGVLLYSLWWDFMKPIFAIDR